MLFVCLAMAGCSPLRIVMNSKTEKGERLVLTSDQKLFGNISAALGAKVAGKDTVLAVLVTYDGPSNHGVFDKDDKLLIRLSDQSVITLKNVYHKEFEEQTETDVSTQRVSDFGYTYSYDLLMDDIYVTPYEVYRFVPRVTTTHKTLSYALYFISKKQINDIMEKGVTKLRIEVEDAEYDMPYPENATNKFTEVYTFLHNAAKAGVKRSSLRLWLLFPFRIGGCVDEPRV